MSINPGDTGINRRGFLKAATAAAAAAAAGAGAALVLDRRGAGPLPPLGETVADAGSVPPAAAQVVTAVDDRELRMASLKAENTRLQIQLENTTSRLQSMQSARDEQEQELVELLQAQLDDAGSRISILSGLVTLYEQFEEIDLESIVDDGLEAVGLVADELSDTFPSLSEGLAAGQRALTTFEEEIPLVEAGHRWIGEQLDRLDDFQDIVDQALEDAGERAGALLERLNRWFQRLLRWLPFGIGDDSAATMAAIGNLVAEVPRVTRAYPENARQPLDQWLVKDDVGQTRLQQRLIKPVRDEALIPLGAALQKSEEMSGAYRTVLAGPAKAALVEKQYVKQLIASYRETYQL